MSVSLRTQRVFGIAKLAGIVLVIIGIVLVAMFATGAVPAQEPRIATTSGSNVVLADSDIKVVAQLPASIFDDSVVVPMFKWATFSNGLIYQGDSIVERSVYGSSVVFDMRAIGYAGDEITIVLVEMSRDDAENMMRGERDAFGRVHVKEGGAYEIIARFDLFIV